MTVTKHDRKLVKIISETSAYQLKQVSCAGISCLDCPANPKVCCVDFIIEWYKAKLEEIELEDLLEKELSDDCN